MTANRIAPVVPAPSAASCAGEPSPWRRASAKTATDAAAGAASGSCAAPEGPTEAKWSGRQRTGGAPPPPGLERGPGPAQTRPPTPRALSHAPRPRPTVGAAPVGAPRTRPEALLYVCAVHATWRLARASASCTRPERVHRSIRDALARAAHSVRPPRHRLSCAAVHRPREPPRRPRTRPRSGAHCGGPPSPMLGPSAHR
jgi:hypothetical protein